MCNLLNKFIIDFQKLLEQAPALFLVLDPNLHIVAVSDAYLKATLSKRKDIIGKYALEAFPTNPHDKQSTQTLINFKKSINIVFDKHVSHQMETQKYDIRNEAGQYQIKYWNFSNHPVLNKDGELLYIIHNVEDITNEYIKEKQIETTEERFALLVSEIKDYAIMLLSRDGIVSTWNTGAQLIYGYIQEEIIGQHIKKFYAMEDIDKHWPEKELEIAKRDGRFEDEGWRIHKDGHKFWARVIITPLYDKFNILYGFGKITADLTIPLRREKIILESEARFKALAQSSNLAIISGDTDGKIIFCNKAAEDMFNYHKDEIIGKSLTCLMPERYWYTHEQALKKYKHGDVSNIVGKTIEVFGLRNGGDEFPLEVSVSSWQTDKKTFFSAMLRDITDRVNKEKELQTLHQSLESRINTLEAFNNTAAHDLNAPLRTIEGFSEIMVEDFGDKVGEAGKTYLFRIHQSAIRMRYLISDLLRLSQINKAIDLKIESVNLSSIVKNVFHDTQLSEPYLDVQFITPKIEIIVQADKNLLALVIDNLMSNAFKFSSKKSHPIIEFGQTIFDNERVYYIKDNGVGFDMAKAHLLFLPFSRLHTQAEFSGNGIGLTIVKRIIELHKGKVWAKAVLNEGATFYFTIGT